MQSEPNDQDPLKNMFEDFFEHSLCGFIVANSVGGIIICNAKIASWAGFSKEELKGKKIADLLTIGGKIYYETHLRPMLHMQGFFDEVVLELRSSKEDKLRVLVNAQERRTNTDNVPLIFYTIVKASDRLQYEQNLQLEKRVAEKELFTQKETVALREQLIAVLGHDLRNPLAAIRMALDVLEYSVLSDEEMKLVTTLKRSSLRMTELVNHIMDFARVRLGEGIILTWKEVKLEPVLAQVVAELKLIYPKREINTHFEIIEPVYCDPDRIGQLLSNLLSNAFTHGFPDKPVFLTVFKNDNVLEISVINSGSAIPENSMANLFTPFVREQNRSSQNGLGLGLYICAEIAKAHGGTLSCISTQKETRFTFHMDYNKPKQV